MLKFKVTVSWKEGVKHIIEANSKDEALALALLKKNKDPQEYYEEHEAFSEEYWEVEDEPAK